jgi:mannose-6-phosphate isomerase
VWGGDKLSTVLGRVKKSEKIIGESWELSSVNDNLSVVSNGFLKNNNIQELIETYMGDIVGDKVYETFGIELPLLFKLIDSAERLSVQVHPDDDVALKRHRAYGKTEMWYVIDAEPGAFVYAGFAKQLTRGKLFRSVESKTIAGMLAKHDVRPGDVFFLPAGTVHAIGAGCLIAEIQQASDVTYRLYDYDRRDAEGKRRELHIKQAKEVIDYEVYSNYKKEYTPQPNTIQTLVDCSYFTTNLIDINKHKSIDLDARDSFSIYICLQGELSLTDDTGKRVKMHQGQTVLIPASTKSVTLQPVAECKLLETYIEVCD